LFKILRKEEIAPGSFHMSVLAPRIAASANPGQFVIVIADKYSERIPLTICDFDRKEGTIDIIVKISGDSTEKICSKEAGEYFRDFTGPLGNPSHLVTSDIEDLKKQNLLFIGGGTGIAPIYPQVKWCYENGLKVDVLIGAKNKDYLIFKEELEKFADNLYITTDDGSYASKGFVTTKLTELVEEKGKKYDQIVTIGPMIMMKFVCDLTKKYGIKTTVSLNPIMVDGTGMCGACRCIVDGKTKFACVDGPEFDGHLVDFETSIIRQQQYKDVKYRRFNADSLSLPKEAVEQDEKIKLEEKLIQEDESLENIKTDRFTRVKISNQAADKRIENFEEVCLGYTEEEAIKEAKRCLNCKNPHCIKGCPVSIDIPGFIKEIANSNFAQAYKVLSNYTSLPAVCGRVCPQETQCEEQCILAKRGDAVSIGKLERFAADYARENQVEHMFNPIKNGHKVAIVGAGPAGLTCASELAKMGYEVTIYEALHILGGVLIYGIPEFRLPDDIVTSEINNLKELGVEIVNDVVIGKTIKIDDLFKDGFEAVFIGSGAGLPKFMNIEGENLNGVFSANEFLTRVNLMRSIIEGYDTPVSIGKKVAIVGGGNVAMDSARVAKRLGSDVTILYRRTDAELPARREEIEHAKEEGIKFEFLCSPVEILGDDKGSVNKVKCIRYELGEPDDSGRRRPVKIEGSEFIEEFQTVIMALGTSPNPLIAKTTDGLDTTSWGGIIADKDGQTTRENVFAGGDAVTGSATVILAMGAGKKAAEKIDNTLRNKN
jgi:glutamate synthase (NADPH/NADH) small chain